MTRHHSPIVVAGVASLFAAMILASPGGARAFAGYSAAEETEQQPTSQMRHTVRFAPDDLVLGAAGDYDTVSLPDAGHLAEAGRPRLPVQIVRIALPDGMKVTSVHAESATWAQLPGRYSIEPAEPPHPKSAEIDRPAFIDPDPAVYGLGTAWPARCVEFLKQTDLAGQSIAVLRVNPIRYIPASGTMSLATSIDICLEGSDGYVCGDYLPHRISSRATATYRKMVEGLVVNPHDVKLRAANRAAPDGRGVEPGEYEYVIVTQSEWVDNFQTLADWRTRCGIRSTIVSKDWIYNQGGYGGTTLERVHAFVEDAHNVWGATHFLIGGDTNIIPYHVRTIEIPGYWTDDIPNDAYYADYDEDWICEVHVGRASVRSADAVDIFVNKVLSYEKAPPLTDYATTAAFFGFDITYCGDGDGEAAKENIRGLHVPAHWTMNTEYDSEPGTHKSDIIGYLNQGHHLVNHHDHCNTDVMGAGWICHGDLVTIADVAALHNADRLSILFAIGCWPCNIPAYTCIGEAAIQNPNGGCVAYMGNSRTGWGGPPEDPDHYSVQQDRFFYRNLFDDGFVRLGENFSDLKNDEYNPYDPYNVHQYCFTQLYLLGDPEMPIWTSDPRGLEVVHDEFVVVGEQAVFEVGVECEGLPVDGATVCLWKEGDVFEVAQTSDGTAVIEFTPETLGTLYVTVTGHNYLPHEGESEIVEEMPCPADVNNDDVVDIDDLFAVLAAWGPCDDCPEDINQDDMVDIDDVFAVLGAWGPCP